MRIKDVAQLAGVSTATVSHVINGTRFVSDEIKQKVRAVIDELNYIPNPHARNLSSGRSTTLGLIVSDIANPFFPELVKSIQEQAIAHGYDVILANTCYDPERITSCVQRMIEQKVRGVAIMTSEMDPALRQRLANRQIPVVYLDLGTVGPYTSNVNVNYEKGIQQGVEHLLELGHRRIAYISGPAHLKSAQRRRAGFTKIMKKVHDSLHTIPFILEGNFKADGGREAIKQLLHFDPQPTAIVCGNDLMAIGALSELKAAGLRVPQDMSVIGFDDILFASLADPPLTTIALPHVQIGQSAIAALLHTINAEDHAGKEFKVKTQLVVRDSTGPVNSH